MVWVILRFPEGNIGSCLCTCMHVCGCIDFTL